jgi:hypothetical protein
MKIVQGKSNKKMMGRAAYPLSAAQASHLRVWAAARRWKINRAGRLRYGAAVHPTEPEG